MAEISGSFRAFPEARDYFQRKLNLPTWRWDELWQAQHAKAFTVAGATKDALLEDLRQAVAAAINDGETIADFRARFSEIVARNGWVGWTGSETAARTAWRTSIIYHTNLRTSYQAGRWETLKGFPYLKYVHNTVSNPREQHKRWDGLIIATDSSWWQTHYPPNGWGCRCTATGVSAARLRALGKAQPDAAPADTPGDPPPEWAYNVGQAAQP
ncbi:phage minor head protein [Xanthomonas phaseoli]|uniref:phage head morphogenesis protein n=1 Tax=Xanthomonas phaseoli TaxID=1985254 RepID=UPI00069F6DA5|nr:phage minor head protein [Xanthomonas phaseoli]